MFDVKFQETAPATGVESKACGALCCIAEWHFGKTPPLPVAMAYFDTP
jgi:hypothetical protein